MAAKVFLVNHPSKAKYTVYFVDRDGQQKNHQIIVGGRLVKSEGQADTKLFVVRNSAQADILITRKNFPE